MENTQKKKLKKHLRKAKTPAEISTSITAWLDAGGHPDDIYSGTERVFRRALESNDESIIDRVLELNKPWTEQLSWRAVRDTVLDGNIYSLKKLIQDDHHTVKLPDQLSHLAVAVNNGRFHCAGLLLKNGFEIDERDTMGFTPLLWVATYGDEAAATFLLKRGAKKDLLTEEKDSRPGKSAGELARKHGHAQFASFLSDWENSTPESAHVETDTYVGQKIVAERKVQAEKHKTSKSGIRFSWGHAIGVIILALGYQFLMAPSFRARNSISGYRPESEDILLMWGAIILGAIVLGFVGGSDDKKD